MKLVLVADRLADPCERCGAPAGEECATWCVLHPSGWCDCGEAGSLTVSLRGGVIACVPCGLGLDPAA